jgi:DNA modification methylase
MSVAMPAALERLPIESLLPYARNSRTHSDAQVAQLVASIREFGFTNPVLVQDDGTIVAGHGRVMAAKQLGLSDVPVIRLSHLSEAQARAYVIADNKLALNAGWDNDVLAAEVKALEALGFGHELMGFSDDEFGELFADSSVQLPVGEGDPDSVPQTPLDPVSRPGDVWVLGRHRLLCGDSTDSSAYAAVMQGGAADVVWTDPPYNVAYEGVAGAIKNDDMSDADFLVFLQRAFGSVASVMRKGASIYVAHADAGSIGIAFRSAFLGAGLKLAQCLIWRKDAMVLGRSDYQWIHEPILYGWKIGAGHKFYGGRKQVSVNDLGSTGSPFVRRSDGRWQITIGEETMIVEGEATVEYVEHSLLREARPKRNDVHPTMKPVALISRMLRNSAKPGATVLDPFGGSGSTLMAAEQLGMCARLIELDPKFVDVIAKRWAEFTGQKPVLEASGEAFEVVARQRGVATA